MTHIGDLEIAARLLLSSILAGLIGLERERHGRPAGLRTHILVSLGSCLIMLISIYGFAGYARDPARLAAQVVSGIGFLGAGTIIREGISVKGLTTAASLWVVAGIGLAIGGGFYFSALMATAFSVLILLFLEPIERRIFTDKTFELKIVTDTKFASDNHLFRISQLLPGIRIKHLELEIDEEKHEALLNIIVDAKNFDKESIISCIMKENGVKRVILK